MELMILRQDIHNVLKYLGEFGDFQFQQDFSLSSDSKMENPDQVVFEKLQKARVDLELEDLDGYKGKVNLPEEKDLESVENICSKTEAIHQSELNAAEESKRASSEYNEALAFSNLQVSYSELESLSFLTLRIGKIDPEKFDELKRRVGLRASVVALGDDRSRILAEK